MAVSGAGGVPCWIIGKRWCHLGGLTSSQTAEMPNRRRIDPGRCKRDSWQVRPRSWSVGQACPISVKYSPLSASGLVIAAGSQITTVGVTAGLAQLRICVISLLSRMSA